MKNKSVSKNAVMNGNAGIVKANRAGYNPKGGSDTNINSHGSRPSQVNKPQLKSYNAGKAQK